MSALLIVDPDELLVSARELRRTVAELQSAAGEVGAAAETGWCGLASLEQAARRREVAELLTRLGSPLEEVAGVLDRVAAAGREQGGLARRLAVVRDERALERSRLLALGPPPEPQAAVHWRTLVALAEEELARLERLIAAAEQEFDRVQRHAARALSQVLGLVPPIVWDLALLVMTVKKVVRGWQQVAAAAAMGASLHRLRTMGVRGGERTIHRTRQRVERHVRRLRQAPPRWVSKVPGGAVVAGRAVPLVAGIDALPKIFTGGGYQGWRGTLTRGLAGVAVVGVAAAVAPLGTTAAVAGLGAAAIYQGWMTGSWIYDNRGRIRGAASRLWSGTRGLAGGALSGSRRAVGRARERAGSALDRLRRRHGHDRLRFPRQGTDPVAPAVAPAGASA